MGNVGYGLSRDKPNPIDKGTAGGSLPRLQRLEPRGSMHDDRQALADSSWRRLSGKSFLCQRALINPLALACFSRFLLAVGVCRSVLLDVSGKILLLERKVQISTCADFEENKSVFVNDTNPGPW